MPDDRDEGPLLHGRDLSQWLRQYQVKDTTGQPITRNLQGVIVVDDVSTQSQPLTQPFGLAGDLISAPPAGETAVVEIQAGPAGAFIQWLGSIDSDIVINCDDGSGTTLAPNSRAAAIVQHVGVAPTSTVTTATSSTGEVPGVRPQIDVGTVWTFPSFLPPGARLYCFDTAPANAMRYAVAWYEPRRPSSE